MKTIHGSWNNSPGAVTLIDAHLTVDGVDETGIPSLRARRPRSIGEQHGHPPATTSPRRLTARRGRAQRTDHGALRSRVGARRSASADARD